MCISIKVFPAANGDCFLIKVEDDLGIKNILIDGGKGELCHSKLKEQFEKLEKNKEGIDLLVVTHIDDDHIGGIIKLFHDKEINDSIINKVWFNSGIVISSKLVGEETGNRELLIIPETQSKEMSVRQGVTFEDLLEDTTKWDKNLILSGQEYTLDNVSLKILSPDISTLNKLNKKWDSEIEKMKKKKKKNRKMASSTDYHKTIDDLYSEQFEEDTSLFNKSSIAFILEYQDYKLLMLGDSHPSIIVSSLKKLGYSKENKLKVNIMKISHHASKKNTSDELLNLIECEKFIISSDGSKHGLPNKQSLARIIRNMSKPVTFYFNYSSLDKIFTPQECIEENVTCIFLDNTNDYTTGC